MSDPGAARGPDQREFFRSVERDYWAEASGLKPEEAALIERHLQPGGPVLDAGTGGGRLARALSRAGFGEVVGFDFAPELVAAAREQAPPDVRFDVADARELPYGDGSFAGALYLQQVVSTIPEAAGRSAALREARRVLRPGAPALFSFVCIEGREASLAGRAYLAYLRALRAARRSERPIQSLPRIRTRGRAGLGAARDRGPYVWWYRAAEAEAELRAAGFAIEGIGFPQDATAGTLPKGATEALARGPALTLYAACRA